jgi:DNA-binding CsgD family transcriptional regulator
MMKNDAISDSDRRILELLVQGGSSKSIGQDLGYKEGTIRVYLHELYKRIGVNNKTRAVTWYLEQTAQKGESANIPGGDNGLPLVAKSFGDFALRSSLLTALGVMSVFLGAYGKTWEVATRLKGAPVDDAKTRARSKRSRQLWDALMKGDFGFGKTLYENGITPKLFIDAPEDCVLLGCLLLIGGYTHAADRVMAALPQKRNGSIGITLSEHTLLVALRDALYGESDGAIATLHHLVKENSFQQTFKHVAMVALYYAYRQRSDPRRAEAVADAIWAEAETARLHLQAVGEKFLFPDAALPEPPQTVETASAYLKSIQTRKPARQHSSA